MDRQLRALALSLFVRQRLTTFIAKERAVELERLTELIESGAVTPSIERTYPLDQVPDAMAHLVAGRARGKLAITV
jgi:NADPH:quinone reductase-like Zn-dependent oxidoreductase